MANGFFAPGGPAGPFQPGSSGVVNPLSLLMAGIYQGNPVGALSAAGTLEQNAIAQRQAQAAQMATMALQRARETRLADDARKAAEGAQAVSGSLYSLLAGDLQTEQNRKALEGAANVPGGPAALINLWTQQAGLAPEEPTGLMREMVSMGITPGSPEWNEMIEKVRTKPLVQQDLGRQTERGKRISERQQLVDQFGPRSEEVQRYDLEGLTAGQQTSIGQIEPARQMLDNIEDLVGDEPGAGVVDLTSPTLGIRARAAASPTFSKLPGMDLSDEEAQLKTYTTQLSNTMLALMRGAQVGPAEQAKFEEQLPIPGQDENVFRSNLAATRKNLQYLIDLYKAQAPSLFSEDGTSDQGFLTDAEERERQRLLRKAQE